MSAKNLLDPYVREAGELLVTTWTELAARCAPANRASRVCLVAAWRRALIREATLADVALRAVLGPIEDGQPAKQTPDAGGTL